MLPPNPTEHCNQAKENSILQVSSIVHMTVQVTLDLA